MRHSLRTTARTALLIAGLASSASAGDVVLGGRSDIAFDSNVYGLSNDEIGDFSLDVAPTVELDESSGSVKSRFFFKPTYELFFDESDLSGFNYDAEGQLSWAPSPTTSIWVDETFARYRNLRSFDPGSSGAPAQLAGRDKFWRNVLRVGAKQRTSPKGELQLVGTYGLWNFERTTRPQQDLYSGALDYSHLVGRAFSVGGSVSFSRQAFDYTLAADNHTDYYNASLSFRFSPAETFVFRASSGPTLIRNPQQSDALPSFIRDDLIRVDSLGDPQVGLPGFCPLLPSGDPFDGPGCLFFTYPTPTDLRLSDPIPVSGTLPEVARSEWTYFADVALEKEWSKGNAAFSYRRDQGSSSGIGFSSVADTLDLRGSYSVRRDLTLTGALTWEDRQGTRTLALPALVTVLGTLPATPTQPAVNFLVPVSAVINPALSSKESIKVASATVATTYAVNRRTSVYASFSWGNQNATPGSGFGDAQHYFTMLGLRVELEPFRW